MHPGGSTILSGAESAMNITAEHMRASYDTYINHGNSSSATIFSVLDRLRSKEMDAYAPGGKVKDHVIGCAFGPGIAVEMCMLKRNLGIGAISGLQTPPETESEASSQVADGDEVGSRISKEEVNSQKTAQEPAPARARFEDADDAFISEALEGLELD
jgi:type III polyketide synthase